MNTFLLATLCLLGAWAALVGGVTVQDGEFSFSLESVKKLKKLQEPGIWDHKQLDGPVNSTLCSHPDFPEELKLLCKTPNAQEILQRLGTIADDPSVCEICAYAACTGC